MQQVGAHSDAIVIVEMEKLSPSAREELQQLMLADREVRPLAEAVKEFQRAYIRRALAAADGKKTRAANLLSISRKNLWEKCKALGID